MKSAKNTADNRRLKRKNKLLKEKIKYMGGSIGVIADIPAQLENRFLKSVIAFEDQYKNAKRVTIQERLGKSFLVKPIAEIADDAYDEEWASLHSRMCEQGIDLSVCSPNISSKELYRFSVEEFFRKEIDSFDLPGMMNCFIYDEYYPDVKYDNERLAVEACISGILSKNDPEFIQYADVVKFNEYDPVGRNVFCARIKKFQDRFEAFEEADASVEKTELDDKQCLVSGHYKTSGIIKHKIEALSGTWSAKLILNEKFGYWHVEAVELQGIDPFVTDIFQD